MIKISKMPMFGDAGEHVKAFQKAIIAKGISVGKAGADGIFGGGTKTGAQKAQKKAGLTGTGVVGPKTLAYLGLELVEVKTPEAGTGTASNLPHINVKTPRKLLPALEALIDNAVEKSFMKEFNAALKANDPYAMFVVAGLALDSLKVREKTNSNDGYIVELIQKVAGGKKGYPWCAYAVQVMIAWVEHKLGLVSKFPNSGSCAEIRSKMPKALIVSWKDSKPGFSWIWRYPNGNGHIGGTKMWKKKDQVMYMFEGNTTKGLVNGKINREGGGFYTTERAVSISGMSLAMVADIFKGAV